MKLGTLLVICAAAVLLGVGHAGAVLISTGFEPAEGYSPGKLTPNQPEPVNDIGWGGTKWADFGGNYGDPNGMVVAAADAPEGTQYYQRLGGGNSNLAYRTFPAISEADGDFSIRWYVRIDTDRPTPPYFNNFATIELDDTGPGQVQESVVCRQAFDWDGDFDVDLLDFRMFALSFTGPR